MRAAQSRLQATALHRGTQNGRHRSGAAMATTLSLSSPFFVAAAPARVGDGIWHGMASASPSRNTANVLHKGTGRIHGPKQQRRMAIVSVLGRKSKTRETVVPDPDYRLPIVILGIAGGLAYTDNLLAAAPVGLLGLLLLFQTTRVRFVFDNEALEVKIGDQLQEGGENVFVGGKNRWKYSSFVNWELWWPQFPILVYFKETQTKPEGQIHFFPVIFNGGQLYDVMVERAGPSKTSGPK